MKSLTGKFASSRGWALLFILFLGACLLVSACGDEETPAPTTPAPPPPPPPPPPPEPEPPATPTGLVVSATTENSITWTWNAVEGATAYAVQVSMDEMFGDDDASALALTPTHTVSDLPASTSVYLRVAAALGTSLEDALLSEWSTHVTGMTAAPPPPPPPPEPPAVPAGLHVSDSGEDFVEWSWDAVEGADGYDVQFSLDEMFDSGDEIIPRGTDQTSYRREPLPAGSDAFLRVRSRSGTGEDRLESEWSTHVTGMTAMPPPPPEPPAVPSGLQVSASGEDFVEWSWNAVEGADGYEVQFSTNEMFDNAETIGRTADETSYRRQPLPAGTTAYVRVRSYSGAGEDRLESSWSTHVTGMTDQPMPPATPANLEVAACGEGCLEWTWDAVEGADGYVVQYSLDDERFTDQDATAELAATETSYRLQDLAADMDVYLRVRSFAGSGTDRLESAWSTHATGMTEAPPPMAPAAPTGVEATAGDDFIEWNWNAVSAAEGYEVQISEDSEFTASDPTRDVGTALSYRHGDLDYDTRRYLRVRAYIGSGADRLSSAWSADATAVTSLPPPPPPSPGTPRGLTATGGEDFVTWTWRAVPDVDGYQVQYSANEAFTSTDPMKDVSAETLSYTREGLEGGTSHYLRVRSYIEVEGTRYESDWSSHATGMTDLPRPAAPTGLAVDADATDHDSIGWEWDAVVGVDGYEAQFSTSQPFADTDQIFSTDTTSQVVHNLEAETSGYLRVRSVIGSGTDARRSDWSATSIGTTGAAPEPDPLAAPENFATTAQTTDSITLGWDQVADAASYEVEQRVAGAGGNWNAADCGGTGSNVVDGTSCVASDLDEGISYEFRVRGIPDDDATPAGDWTELTATTDGRQQTTTPGGMGDLNVTWTSTADTITFSWEPASGVSYEWMEIGDSDATRLTALDSANPCGGTTFDSVPNTNKGANFSETFDSVATGDIRGLCVRIDDEDLDDDEKALSWAWGATTPVAPTLVSGTPSINDRRVATTLDWETVNLKKGFEWELRLVADSGRNNGDLSGAATAKLVQNACAAGTFVDQGDADLNLAIDYTWDGAITPYTGYLLCLKYANTAGSTAWAVPVTGGDITEIYTPAAPPPSPQYRATRSTTAPDGETRTLVWIIANRNSVNVPRQMADFGATVITYPLRYDHDGNAGTALVTTPAPMRCEAAYLTDGPSNLNGGSNPWNTSTNTAAITNDLEGLAATSSAIDIPENNVESSGVRLCVQANKNSAGGALLGQWVIGGGTTITKKPAF